MGIGETCTLNSCIFNYIKGKFQMQISKTGTAANTMEI